jgi:glycosyltransferase involved in cell wall biosynthesis
MNHYAEARALRSRIEDLADPTELEHASRIASEALRRTSAIGAPAARPLRLSAVVATYQGQRFLREQLRSMLAQSVALDEIVIADDCSSDSTMAVAEEVKADSPIPIRILRGERNVGIGKNFERGLRAAKGDIVFLADQDDAWRHDKVARTLKEFAVRPDLNLLFTNARLVNDAGNSLHDTLFRVLRIAGTERRRVKGGQAFDALLRRNLATGATIAMRRSAMLNALPIPDYWLHDEWIAMISSASGRIDFLDETLTDYRQHDNNHVGSQRETFLSALEKLRRCRRQFNRRLLRRTELQIERLRTLDPPIAEHRVVAVQAKLEHLRRRCQLPSSRLARLPLILGEMINGGYRHYSSGWRSIAGDLFGVIREAADQPR